MTIQSNLEEVIFRSSQFQERIRGQIDEALHKLKVDHNGLQQYKDKVQDLLIKLIKILHEKVIVHPIVEKCQTFTRNVLLEIYRKCLPFLARISENSLIAGGIGFGLGLVVSYWIF